MITTVSNLNYGQYFQCGSIIARLTSAGYDETSATVVFFNEKPVKKYTINVEELWNLEVIPIDYQTAVALLTKECIDNNQFQSQEPPSILPRACTLPAGQFCICYNKISRIGSDSNVYYLNKYCDDTWDCAKNQIVQPITFPQAVLLAAQEIINESY